jgi:putative NIF3 family GTP cyclohydrolase 1 type 2
MIIAYHPPIFKPLSSMTLSNPIQTSLLRCATAGISVYSPHSALDSVYEGINDWLASGLGSGRIDLIGDGHPSGRGGFGRLLTLDEKVTLSTLQERVKKHLGVAQCLYLSHVHPAFRVDRTEMSPRSSQCKWLGEQTALIMRFNRWRSALAREALCWSE